jgi:5-methylcytosine-specific restriction endonuclease McrA
VTQNPRIVSGQIAALRRRDGDNCWICGQPIDFTITDLNDPMSRSRDHVIPRVAGGSNTIENKRLAHRKCNSGRGSDGWSPYDAQVPGGLVIGDEPVAPCLLQLFLL